MCGLIATSSPQLEGPFLASKWQQQRLLIDQEEMENLLEILGSPLDLYCVSHPVLPTAPTLSKETFLSIYGEYVDTLRRGFPPDPSRYRFPFSSAWSVTSDAFYASSIPGDGRLLVRAKRPIVQMQSHTFHYSSEEGKIRSMVFGPDATLWGLQFAYPHLFQDPQTLETFSTTSKELFPNTALWRKMQHWIRRATDPVTWKMGEKRVVSSLRIGKKCYGWINSHPQLREKGWSVVSHVN